MSDRFAAFLFVAMVGSACVIVAALPHLSAYAQALVWAHKLFG